MAQQLNSGTSYTNSIYRSASHLMLAHTAGGALSFPPILSKSSVDALVDAHENPANTILQRANGIVLFGPSDAVELLFFIVGVSNQTASYQFSLLNPIEENGVIVAYARIFEAEGVVTASTTVAGLAVTGISATDLVADIITQDYQGSAIVGTQSDDTYFWEDGSAPLTQRGSVLRAQARCAPIGFLQVLVGTATTVAVVARRFNGTARPGKGGGG